MTANQLMILLQIYVGIADEDMTSFSEHQNEEIRTFLNNKNLIQPCSDSEVSDEWEVTEFGKIDYKLDSKTIQIFLMKPFPILFLAGCVKWL